MANGQSRGHIEPGELVAVFLDAELDGKRTVSGVLSARHEHTVTLQDEHGRVIEIPWTRIVALRQSS